MIKVLCILFLSGLMSSCATYHFIPIPDGIIQIKNDRGSSYPIFKDEKVGLIIIPEYKDSELMIKVTIRNLADSQISITDSDFEVYISEDRINWKNVKVYSSMEYYKKEKAEYTAGAVLMVLGAAANTYNAGQGYSSTNGTVYGQSRYGSYSGSYSSRTSYYDPVAAEMSNQRNAQMVANYAQNGKQWLEVLENNLFYNKDLGPDEEYFGLIFSEKISSNFIRIICKNEAFSIVSIEYEKVTD